MSPRNGVAGASGSSGDEAPPDKSMKLQPEEVLAVVNDMEEIEKKLDHEE